MQRTCRDLQGRPGAVPSREAVGHPAPLLGAAFLGPCLPARSRQESSVPTLAAGGLACRAVNGGGAAPGLQPLERFCQAGLNIGHVDVQLQGRSVGWWGLDDGG